MTVQKKYNGKKYSLALFSMLFLFVFGTAFYLIYTDSEAVKEQINNDFNEQQLILARQVSGQTEIFLNNLTLQLNNLSWFFTNKSMDFFHEEIRVFYDQNKSLGIIDAGYIDVITGGIKSYRHRTNSGSDSCFAINIYKKNISQSFNSHDKINAIICNEGNNIILTIHTLVRHKEINPAIIYARLNLTAYFEKIAGSIRSGKSGYAWVIDEHGLALYHPEKNFIGRNIFEARQKRKPYVNFSQINNIMKEKMMKGGEGKGIYESWWHRDLKGHTIKLIAYTPVKNDLLPDGSLWSIAVVAPISEVADAVDKAYTRHFWAEAAIILGMFLFIIIMYNYQKRTSASLKEKVNVQEEYIASILKNTLDGIIITDKENNVKIWNKGAERIFGYAAEEMTGHTFHRLIPPDMDAATELKKLEDLVLQKGYVSNYIAPRITKDGRRITVNISRTLITNDKGERIGDTIIIRDETEKMELEQRIYHTEKLASIGNLAAGVAHEINNPLAVVLGFTDLLIERFPPGSPVYDDLKIIESNANNARKIVENLLGFARITEGLEDNIDICRSINTVVGIIKNTLFTQKIEISVDVPADLPHVKGDVREYQQVLFNLINNSVSAMKKYGQGKLSIAAVINEGMIDVSISDTGEGISEKIKHRIFDPFFTTKKVGEGTGLGLSLCYGIVSKYGGRISFTSISEEDEPDCRHGTTFIISMPVLVQEKLSKPENVM